MSNPKIMVMSGSSRAGSVNTKLAALVGKKLALADADVTIVSLKDYPLPLYDGDYESASGVPAPAQKLKKLMQAQDGIFIACPEYNAGITPLLKNTLDWVSRINEPGEPQGIVYKGRVFAIGSASPGAIGGLRGLIGMRTILEVGLGALVLPQMVSVGGAMAAFDEKGDLTDSRLAGMLDAMVAALLKQVRLQKRD
ncbi:NADPH-dependent FMN reductase [Roseibium sediminis]|uniref:NADPH-dependent FMN reductase n=1 Tax=Roseibium sediminis TaxID=1775174 RepID=UPI00123C905F|nr:NAD(P)H-dependent oxidoreductase [Roseibium sediminis]